MLRCTPRRGKQQLGFARGTDAREHTQTHVLIVTRAVRVSAQCGPLVSGFTYALCGARALVLNHSDPEEWDSRTANTRTRARARMCASCGSFSRRGFDARAQALRPVRVYNRAKNNKASARARMHAQAPHPTPARARARAHTRLHTRARGVRAASARARRTRNCTRSPVLTARGRACSCGRACTHRWHAYAQTHATSPVEP